MITIPVFCPTCQKVANAKADPVGLLFGGASDFTLKCEDCGTVHRAVIRQTATGVDVSVREPIPSDDDE